MRESKRKAREQLKHDKALAQLLGKTLEEVQALREKEDRDDKAKEVQAVHLFLERPDAFIEKLCDECQGLFLTTYKFVSLCSNKCRIISLERIGIMWNPMHTAEERWTRTQIPTEYSIPPQALKILLALAQQQELSENPTHNQNGDEMVQAYQAAGMYPLPDFLTDEPSELSPNISQSSNDLPESPDDSPPALEEWEV